MTTPWDQPRRAVERWSTSSPAGSSPAGSSPGARVAEGGAFLPLANAVGVYNALHGALVATYPAVGYDRLLDWLSATCSHSGVISLYYGAISDTSRFSTYGDGSRSEYDPNRPRLIPQGAPLLVVWTVPNATHTASCMAGFRQA